MPIYLLIIPAVFFGDKKLKDRAERELSDGRKVPLAGGRISLKICRNYGAMLNAFDDKPRLVRVYSAGMSIVLTLLLILMLITGKGKGFRLAAALALGGAYSNTWDKFKRGYVVDYVSFPAAGKALGRLIGSKRGAYLGGIVFNISDFFIIAGETAAIAALISES